MAHFPDLSTYTYSPGEQQILNIGWLASAHPFSRGTVSHAFAIRLQKLVKSPCNVMRGLHYCDFCKPPQDIIEIDPSYIFVWELNRCGTGEVRVTNVHGETFAAPSLIWHYVAEHQYQPPQVFIEAVIYATDHPETQPSWSE